METSKKISQTADFIKAELDHYLGDFEDLEEFYAFMADENNLYDADGKPTDAYCQWMKRIEAYMQQYSIKDMHLDNTENRGRRIQVIEAIEDYFETKKKYLKKR